MNGPRQEGPESSKRSEIWRQEKGSALCTVRNCTCARMLLKFHRLDSPGMPGIVIELNSQGRTGAGSKPVLRIDQCVPRVLPLSLPSVLPFPTFLDVEPATCDELSHHASISIWTPSTLVSCADCVTRSPQPNSFSKC